MFDWLPTWWLLPRQKPRLQHDDRGLRNRGYGSGRHNARWALQQVWRTASARWGVTKPTRGWPAPRGSVDQPHRALCYGCHRSHGRRGRATLPTGSASRRRAQTCWGRRLPAVADHANRQVHGERV